MQFRLYCLSSYCRSEVPNIKAKNGILQTFSGFCQHSYIINNYFTTSSVYNQTELRSYVISAQPFGKIPKALCPISMVTTDVTVVMYTRTLNWKLSYI